MKIARVEHLHADAGQRNFDFLKLTTDDGLVGWSEYNESFGGLGVSAAIDGLASQVIGRDPRAYEAIVTQLYAVRRQASGGVVQQAIGAIENALLDLKAKALGVPVYELLGGPVRDRIRLYWSHCGTYRLQWSKEMQIPPLRTLQDCRQRRQGGRESRLHRAQDQRVRAGRRPLPALARLRPARPRLPRAERRPPRAEGHPRASWPRSGRGPGRTSTSWST